MSTPSPSSSPSASFPSVSPVPAGSEGEREPATPPNEKWVAGSWNPHHDRKRNEAAMSGFIFNPDEILAPVPFSQFQHADFFGYGFLLPREVDVLDKNGHKIGTRQDMRPAVLTSTGRFFEIFGGEIKGLGIRFEAMPSAMSLRMNLQTISAYALIGGNNSDVAEIHKSIRDQFEKFLYLHPTAYYSVLALWVIATYVFQIFPAFPLLEMRGMKGSGKTKTMRLISFLAFNSTPVMISPTEAVLFREVHEQRPTKIIDEAEGLFRIQKGKVEHDARVEVLNSSYARGSYVPRIEKVGNKFVTMRYGTYSPCIVGSINGLYGALEDRALQVHISKPSFGDDRVNMEPNAGDPVFEELRSELYLLGLHSWQDILKAFDVVQVDGLRARELELWRPLLAIASLIDKDVYNEVYGFAKAMLRLKEGAQQEEGTLEWEVARVLDTLFDATRPNAPQLILNSEIRKNLPESIQAHPKTITRVVDGFGLAEFREHSRTGNGWRLSFNKWREYVSCIFSSFSSQSSQHTQKEGNDVKEREENIENVKENSVKQISEKDLSFTDFQDSTHKCEGVKQNGQFWDKPGLYCWLGDHEGIHPFEAIEAAVTPVACGKLQDWLKELARDGMAFEPRAGFWQVLK